VLAHLRCGCQRRSGLVELYRTRDQGEGRAVAAIDDGQVVVGLCLRVVVHLARALHRRPHALGFCERRPPFGEGAGCEGAIELRDARLAVLEA
jgi:hypothetical protein